jgi:hypothetical protein
MRLAVFVPVMGFGGLLASCNAVLGINEAVFDPEAGRTLPSQQAASSESGAPDAGVDAASLYALTCDNYCSLISIYCSASSQGDNTEYLTSDAGICSKMCSEFEVSGEMISPATEPTDTNTLNCRVWHVNAARLGTPHTHCPHAGPLGGTVCDNAGDPCEPFCRMDVDFCTGPNAAYTSYDDCLSACRPDVDAGYAGYPYAVNVNDPEVSDLGAQFQAGSNTLNCRMYHLENYLRTGDAVHCTHTSRTGNGVCTSLDGG